MTDQNIAKAKEAAEYFIICVDEMLTEEQERPCEIDGKNFGYYESPKHRGSTRRASMELTRALAEMRKP